MSITTPIITSNTKVCAESSQLSCELQDEAVILDTKNKLYYGLEPVAAKIWKLIQQPTTVGDVVKSIVAEFEVEEEQCLRDCVAFLTDLRAKELIKLEGS